MMISNINKTKQTHLIVATSFHAFVGGTEWDKMRETKNKNQLNAVFVSFCFRFTFNRIDMDRIIKAYFNHCRN